MLLLLAVEGTSINSHGFNCATRSLRNHVNPWRLIHWASRAAPFLKLRANFGTLAAGHEDSSDLASGQATGCRLCQSGTFRTCSHRDLPRPGKKQNLQETQSEQSMRCFEILVGPSQLSGCRISSGEFAVEGLWRVSAAKRLLIDGATQEHHPAFSPAEATVASWWQRTQPWTCAALLALRTFALSYFKATWQAGGSIRQIHRSSNLLFRDNT